MSRRSTRPMRGVLGAAALTAIVALAPRAAAGGPDGVAAQALFERGKELALEGAWEEACKKFEASLALDATASTQVKVARCLEREGRVASAWAAYVTARKLNRATPVEAHRDEIEGVIQGEVAALEPRLPRLRVRIGPRPPGLRVLLGQVELPLGALGESLPVDPGLVTVSASAPGFGPARGELVIAEGQARELQLRLSPLPVAPPPQRLGPRAAQVPGPPPEEASPWRFLGAAALGAGVATMAVSVGFGVATLDKVARSDAECDEQDRCTTAGLALRSDASDLQGIGIGLAVGGVSLAAVGVSVLLLEPAAETPERTSLAVGTWASADRAGLQVQGILQ